MFAVSFGEVLPGGAGAGNPEHGVDKTAVVVGVSSGVAGFAREQRLNPGVVVVGDVVSVHLLGGCRWGKPFNRPSKQKDAASVNLLFVHTT